VEEGSFP
jgi:hypothetical protein